jgi:hypothetical protein
MYTPDSPPLRPARSRHSWAALEAIGASALRSFAFLGLRVLGLGIFALADVVVIKGTVDIVLRESDEVSWFVSILLALGAVVMAASAGHLSRRAAVDGSTQLIPHLLVLGWLGLGVALVLIRFNAATWTVPPPQVEGVAAPAFDEAGMHQGLAGLLALLFLASGVWAYVEGRTLVNPVAIAYLWSEVRRRRLLAREVAQNAILLRDAEDLQRARGHLLALEPAREAAEDARRALARQLMTEARVRIAIHLADPASTGITEIAPTRPELGPLTPDESDESNGFGESEAGR